MIVSDVGKLVLMGVFVVGCFALVISGNAELLEVAPFLTLVVGYLTGNGATAIRKAAPSAVVVPNIHPGEVATVHGPDRSEQLPDPAPGQQHPGEDQFWTRDQG